MRLRVGNTRLRVGNTRLAVGSSGGSAPPTVSVSAIALSPATGTANSASGTVVGALSATVANGPLISPVWTLLSSAGGDFQITGGNQVAFLPNNVPAGSYSITAQVAASNLATPFSAPLTVTIGAGQTVAPTPTGAANRLDLLLALSAAAPGATVAGSAVPNGLWPTTTGQTVTLSNGTVISLPSTGSAAVSFSITAGAAGEVSLTATNTAGLYNPYPAPLTVYATSSGTAQTISANLTRNDQARYQRDTASGAPAGFSSSAFTRGWGEVWVNVSAIGGATGGLFVRLYDALSTGATSTAGTGTQITGGSVQVYGPVSAAGAKRLLLPASAYIYYLDLATDAAFTNPVRIAQRFGVGHVHAHSSRSQEDGLVRPYAYGTPGPALGVTYAKAATCVAYDRRYSNTSAIWFRQDGVSADPDTNHYGDGCTSGAMEFGRLIEQQLGVVCGIVGVADSGGGMDNFVNHDGSLSQVFTDTVNASCGGKFRSWTCNWAGWDAVNSSYPSQYPTEGPARLAAVPGWIAQHFPACAIIAPNTGDSGWFGPNASQATGEGRDEFAIQSQIEPVNPMVIARADMLWNEFNGGHSTMGARRVYVRSMVQAILDVEVAVMGGNQSTNHGPTLATTGAWVAGSSSIRIPFKGSGVSAIGATFSSPAITINSASTAEVASLFGVYPAGGGWGNGTPISVASATINTTSPPTGYAGTIDLVLQTSGGALVNGLTQPGGTNTWGAGTQAVPSSFSVHFGDFGAGNPAAYPQYMGGPARGIALCDNRDDLGVGYGRQMRRQLGIAVS